MATAIKTTAPSKGDLVVGHKVYGFFADPKLPAVPGVVVEVSQSGAWVVVEVDRFLSALGLPRRSKWTWRRSVGAYQPEGEKTKRGTGLAIRAA